MEEPADEIRVYSSTSDVKRNVKFTITNRRASFRGNYIYTIGGLTLRQTDKFFYNTFLVDPAEIGAKDIIPSDHGNTSTIVVKYGRVNAKTIFNETLRPLLDNISVSVSTPKTLQELCGNECKNLSTRQLPNILKRYVANLDKYT